MKLEKKNLSQFVKVLVVLRQLNSNKKALRPIIVTSENPFLIDK